MPAAPAERPPIANRLLLIGSWAVAVGVLWVYPGYECRGLLLATILGMWPVDALIGIDGGWWTLGLGTAVAALPVVGLGWLWDRWRLGHRPRAFLLTGMAAAALLPWWLLRHDYEAWERAMPTSDSGEGVAEWTRGDHLRLKLIPLGAAAAALWIVLAGSVILAGERAWARLGRRPGQEGAP